MMRVEQVPVGTLVEDQSNSRLHSQRSLASISASLVEFGQQKPLVVDEDNVVRAGNGTLRAAVALGWETISIVRSSLGGNALLAYAIADNRTSELSTWDSDTLIGALSRLRENESESLVDATGFDAAAIDAMMGVEMPAEFDLPVIPAPSEDEPDPTALCTMSFRCSLEQSQVISSALDEVIGELELNGARSEVSALALTELARRSLGLSGGG